MTYSTTLHPKKENYMEFFTNIFKKILGKTKPNPSDIIYLDLETTGLDASIEEILQISIIDDTGKVLLDSLVKPNHTHHWEEAEKINLISPSMVSNAPSIEELRPKIQAIINSAKIICIYGASFDTKFLRAVNINVKNESIVDVLKLVRKNINDTSNHKLTTIASHLGFDYTNQSAHNALTDVKATKYVYDYLRQKE